MELISNSGSLSSFNKGVEIIDKEFLDVHIFFSSFSVLISINIKIAANRMKIEKNICFFN